MLQLPQVLDAVQLSQATFCKIRQNLWWAFGYNLIGIPLAAGALLPSAGIVLTPSISGGLWTQLVKQPAGCEAALVLLSSPAGSLTTTSCATSTRILAHASSADAQELHARRRLGCNRVQSFSSAGALMGVSSLAVMANSLTLQREGRRRYTSTTKPPRQIPAAQTS